MTKNKFYNTRFGAGMKAVSQNGYKYPIKGVDFLEGELLLKTDIGEIWVSYRDVSLDESYKMPDVTSGKFWEGDNED